MAVRDVGPVKQLQVLMVYTNNVITLFASAIETGSNGGCGGTSKSQ